jgi:hypothetical protein
MITTGNNKCRPCLMGEGFRYIVQKRILQLGIYKLSTYDDIDLFPSYSYRAIAVTGLKKKHSVHSL